MFEKSSLKLLRKKCSLTPFFTQMNKLPVIEFAGNIGGKLAGAVLTKDGVISMEILSATRS